MEHALIHLSCSRCCATVGHRRHGQHDPACSRGVEAPGLAARVCILHSRIVLQSGERRAYRAQSDPRAGYHKYGAHATSDRAYRQDHTAHGGATARGNDQTNISTEKHHWTIPVSHHRSGQRDTGSEQSRGQHRGNYMSEVPFQRPRVPRDLHLAPSLARSLLTCSGVQLPRPHFFSCFA
jgi:hypothetical protein